MYIQCRDSNSQLLEHESPPITTRPGQDLLAWGGYLKLPLKNI